MHGVALGLALLAALAIMAIGALYLARPLAVACSFGLPPPCDVPVVAPGWYRVSLAADPTSEPYWAFPAKLARPDLSGLVREVKPDRENVFEFAVEVPQATVATR